MRSTTEGIVTYLLVFLTVLFWPLNFLLHNSLEQTFHFFLPSILAIGGVGFMKNFLIGRSVVLGAIPLVNSSLLFVPLLISTLKRNIFNYLLIALVVGSSLFFAWKPFLGSSIFYFSLDDQQKIIRQTYLYPDIYTARLFQNKLTIYTNRFLFNFFALIDPNNYFFGFHPREIAVENQNLQKFPFLTAGFFLIGLYHAIRNKRCLLGAIVVILVNLALLKNFDKTDAILWLPLSILIIDGIIKFTKTPLRLKLLGIGIFFIFTLTEYLHLIINFLTNP